MPNQITDDTAMAWGDGTNSDIGEQLRLYKWDRESLKEARKKSFLMDQSATKYVPKHFGKTIKVYHYLPILDDRNINTQGIDPDGNYDPEVGNLWGSSKDIGAITGKLPVLSEHGGRVNRVGYTRLTVSGTFATFGFFHEFTKDDLNYDTDAEKQRHIRREMINAAFEITEKQLMIDLITNAGVIQYGGDATNMDELTGETGAVVSEMTYEGLLNIENSLDLNNTPTDTTIITGTRLIDTNVVNEARFMYVHTNHRNGLMRMKNLHGEKAFISAAHYASGGTLRANEIGMIDGLGFRVIRHPEMVYYAGGGADVKTNGGFHETGGKYDVFPALVVGDESFVTIGFQMSGSERKFIIQHANPGENGITSYDPYGFTGLSSIYWHYGFMALRPERIAKILTVARR